MQVDLPQNPLPLAFPSQTLYIGRDRGIDSIKAGEVKASVEDRPKKHD
jgi:hypothetical protein